MKCLPAIDILDGKCVRLTKGDFDKSKIYNESPMDQAKIFENAGFKEIHIVDLNGAKSGNRLNLSIISKIASNTGLTHFPSSMSIAGKHFMSLKISVKIDIQVILIFQDGIERQ